MTDFDFGQVLRRLADKRSARRRLGWFDFSSDSYDMRTTAQRAVRIAARIRGQREPLTTEYGWVAPWNSYLN